MIIQQLKLTMSPKFCHKISIYRKTYIITPNKI